MDIDVVSEQPVIYTVAESDQPVLNNVGRSSPSSSSADSPLATPTLQVTNAGTTFSVITTVPGTVIGR